MNKITWFVSLLLSFPLFAALPSGDAATDRAQFRLDAMPGTGKMELIRDGERNAVKITLLKYAPTPEGSIRYQVALYTGGTKELVGMGFPAKPNTRYQWSFDLKGQGERIFISAYEMNSDSFWNNRNRLKITGSNHAKLISDWKTCSGSFTTGDKAQRVTLLINFYGDEKHKDIPETPGDYFMISNLKLEE